MLRTLPQTRDHSLARRIAGIAAFTVLIAISARVEIYFGSPIPFTLQVLTVLLAGMVLGSVDGAASALLYLVLMRLNLPIGAGGAGASALLGATAGYLIGFVPAAFVVGLLTERGQMRFWQRWLAGIVGVAVIYVFGATMLKLYLNADWSNAWTLGVQPFIAVDLAKAIIAASLAEGGRALLLRNAFRA